MFHVAVIGAGPAGSVSALLLARSGIDVTLIEQHRFPRDKVCGECLSTLGIDVLSRLRLLADLQHLAPRSLRRVMLFPPDARSIELALPRPMLGVSRRALDHLLLQAARDAGARIVQPARCESLKPLRLRTLDDNRTKTLHADLIVLANGRGQPSGDFGVKAHFIGVNAPPDTIALFGVQGHYGGIAPIEADRWNLAFSVPAARIRHFAHNYDRLLQTIMLENRHLGRWMSGARRTSDWLVSPLPRSAVRDDWSDRVIPVGNAAAAIEPIGGEGIGLAMRSAELAAGNILAAVQGDHRVDVQQLRSEYRKLWGWRGPVCRGAAIAISNPPLARLLAQCLAPGDPIIASVLRAIGKT
ncbi:NAD(P)/FAD-dependent oxidoreductase [Fontivita pretiosa]|uniref:NAD(P)/FAD-dependent oxidoreductase n=1 Tax=Fontivita pretiosa TaxID=2989684 RepID=UPI003D186761